MSLKKVIACIKRNRSFLITVHTNPEGDALGAELAFYRLLKKLGKEVVIVNEDDVPKEYNFLSGTETIKKYRKNLEGIRFDCFVTLDCSDLRRTGEVYRMNIKNKPILNIDHHTSNGKFGDVNWIEPNASSCSEMIFKLYKKLHIPFDKDASLFLYVGMLTDTGSFHYANTTSFTHKAVSELLKHNLEVPQIYKNIYENISFKDMKLLSRILLGMKRQLRGKIIWFQIERNMLKNKKLSFDLTEEILSFARAVQDTEVAVLFKENLGSKDEIRVNLRSQGKVDVNKIASFFGGGGHKTASGCTIHGKIERVRRMVLGKIRDSLK